MIFQKIVDQYMIVGKSTLVWIDDIEWDYGNSIAYLIEAKWRIYTSVIWPSLVKIMACRQVGAKPLSEPMLEYW